MDYLLSSPAQIVTNNIHTAAVFERYGIDFCCKGKRPLAETCREKNINSDELVQALRHVHTTDEQQWNNADVEHLINHIVHRHHEYIRTILPVINAHLNKVVSRHGRDNPALLEVSDIFDAMQHELQAHMIKEETVLFPYIKNLHRAFQNNISIFEAPFGSVENPIRVMEQEHDHAGAATEKISSLTNFYTAPQGACNTFRALYAELDEFEKDLHNHVHLENNILFPKAKELELLVRTQLLSIN